MYTSRLYFYIPETWPYFAVLLAYGLIVSLALPYFFSTPKEEYFRTAFAFGICSLVSVLIVFLYMSAFFFLEENFRLYTGPLILLTAASLGFYLHFSQTWSALIFGFLLTLPLLVVVFLLRGLASVSVQ